MEAKLPAEVPAKHASQAEFAAAVETLFNSPSQLLKLQQYARFRVQSVGRAAEGRNYEDLLSEAVTRTLEGERKWNKAEVDLVGHLMGAMRSISSHWTESVSAREAPTYLESEVTLITAEGQAVSEVEQQPLKSLGPDRVLGARQLIVRIDQAFGDDPEVTQLLEGLRAELTGPEIQELLGISRTEYETRMKRLRRRARTLDEGRVARHG